MGIYKPLFLQFTLGIPKATKSWLMSSGAASMPEDFLYHG